MLMFFSFQLRCFKCRLHDILHLFLPLVLINIPPGYWPNGHTVNNDTDSARLLLPYVFLGVKQKVYISI